MASQDSRDSKILLCLGLLLVAGSFSHCARLTKLKALDKLRGNSTTSSGQAKVSEQHHGRLLIGLFSREGVTKNLLDVDADYQDDMGWGEGYSKPNAERDSVAVDRLLKLEPKVECTGNSMRLEVQDAASTPGSLFFVDRGSRLSPLPLSKLPPSCGYTIKSSRRDLVLVAPYDGCFVALEEDCYVLPLRWCGLPVRMSCPIMKQSSPDPPMVTCHDQGMVVKTSWMVPVAKIGVKVNGNWEPLIKASARCGFSVVLHPEGVVISVHYAPCLDSKDGMYTLNLAGEGEIHISCPSLSPALMKNITQLNPSQSAVPKIPEKPDQGPEDIKGIKLPQPTTTPKPSPKTIPFVAPSAIQPETQVQQLFYPSFSYYPQPEKPTTAPEPEYPQGPVQQPFYPLPYYPQLKPFYPFPYDPQPKPEKPATAPETEKTTTGPEKPTAAPKPPQPDTPQSQVQWPSYPEPPKPDAPQGQVQHPFYPFPYYPQPGSEKPTTTQESEKPTKASKPPQPDTPQGQVQWPSYPFPYYPEAPQGQVQQPFYPFPYYPQPGPEKPTSSPEPKKPTAAPKPPRPDTPQGQPRRDKYRSPFTHSPTTLSQSLESQLLQGLKSQLQLPNLHSQTLLRAKYNGPPIQNLLSLIPRRAKYSILSTHSPTTLSQGLKSQPVPQNLRSQLQLPNLHSLKPHRAKYSSPFTHSPTTLSQSLESQLPQGLKSQLQFPNLHSQTLLRAKYNGPPIQNLLSLIHRRAKYSILSTHSPTTLSQGLKSQPVPQNLRSQLQLPNLHSLKPRRAKYSSPFTHSPTTLSQGLKSQPVHQNLRSQLQLPNLHSLKPRRDKYSSPFTHSPTTLSQSLESQLPQGLKSQLQLPNLHSQTFLRAKYNGPPIQNLLSLKPRRAKYSILSTHSPTTLSQGLKSQPVHQNLRSQVQLPNLHSLKPHRDKYSSPFTHSPTTLSQSLESQLPQGLKSQLQLPNLHSQAFLRAKYNGPPIQNLLSLKPRRAKYSILSTHSPTTLSQGLKSQPVHQNLRSQVQLPNLHSLKPHRDKYSSPFTHSPTTLSQSLESQLPQGLKSQLQLPDLNCQKPLRAKCNNPSTLSPTTLSQSLKRQLMLLNNS
ncbi:hypothetical protein PBY51_021054 [Eleginops maclovinus]|uniref:Uncharacterized protein n=1 Tax=Eleginops maclovinus TaxID=56733 RepID=A0AAN7X8D2_ELEMC|nr:hypothetical protein PBY51_021054 [Eleginops maclovinus]